MSLVGGLGLVESCYLVADAYYAKGKVIKGMLTQGHDLVTRARSDCVAYHPAKKAKGKARCGRPKLYGKKVKLHNLFRSALKIDTLISPVHDERTSNCGFERLICCGNRLDGWCVSYWWSIQCVGDWC